MLGQAAENPPKKPHFGQSSFLHWPRVSTSVPTRAYTTNLDLRQHPPCGEAPTANRLVGAVYTCRGSLLLSRRVLSAFATTSELVLLLNHCHRMELRSARGAPAAGQHAVIQHPPKLAQTSGLFSPLCPLNENSQARALPWEKRAGNTHCFKQLSNLELSSKARQSVLKKARKQTSSFSIDLLFSKWEGRGESTVKTIPLLLKLSISLPHHQNSPYSRISLAVPL